MPFISGELSQALIARGGQQIVTYVQQAPKLTSHCVTNAGQLNCNQIIHMATPKKANQVSNAIVNVLTAAENLKASSIALPAFGTGKASII